jgi:hypothetical protein
MFITLGLPAGPLVRVDTIISDAVDPARAIEAKSVSRTV